MSTAPAFSPLLTRVFLGPESNDNGFDPENKAL